MQKKIRILQLGFASLLVLGNPGSMDAQTMEEAGSYINAIDAKTEDMRKELWDYICSFTHGRSAKKIESDRVILLKSIFATTETVKEMPAFYDDCSLRDSVIDHLRMDFHIINNDFAKIIDMEKVAEQSYDAMEAYLLTNKRVNEKLEKASEQLDTVYFDFAGRYRVTLVEKTDKLSIKLRLATEALDYYNQVYLVFFKAYMYETQMWDALDRKDPATAEIKRNSLREAAIEGMAKLDSIGHFKADYTLNSVVKKIMLFYRDEAEKQVPIVTDFMAVQAEYNEMASLFESKDRMFITNEEVERYNRAADQYNKGLSRYNATKKTLPSRRKYQVDSWNNAAEYFMERHIPKK